MYDFVLESIGSLIKTKDTKMNTYKLLFKCYTKKVISIKSFKYFFYVF